MADDGVAGWSRLHGQDVSGNALAVGWLRLIHRLARYCTGVSPDVLTGCGVLTGISAVALAGAAGPWRWGTLALVLATGVLDGLDGAVALRTGRARPLGAVWDAFADRLTDLCFAGVLLVLGAPVPWCAALAGLVLCHEYLRARAQGAGMTGAGAITVAERPTRIVVVAVAAAGSAAAPAGTPLTGWNWASTCAALWLVLSVIGLAHLGVAVVRALSRPAGEVGGDRG
jgi:phosphatidylglycerophosphate synthase